MREIKFRAWWRDQKRMHYLPSLQTFGNYSFPLSWCDLMQFTGLLDKNGKEIYVGDIVRFKHYIPTEQYGRYTFYEARWDEYGFNLFDKHGYRSADTLKRDFANGNSWRWEVIGNIYESPSLLVRDGEGKG